MITLHLEHIDTPIGELFVIASEAVVYALGFPQEEDETNARQRLERQPGAVTWANTESPLGATAKLRAYFDGDLHALTELPVAPQGTEFQRRVWAALRDIPVGVTTSYGAIAATIGSPTGSRAVGLANGKNPISVIIPCHRVIGANSSLTGYAGGLERKQWLLTHEQDHRNTV